jgi:hypothetical protein
MEEDGMITGQRVKFFRRCNRGARGSMRGASLIKTLLLIPAALVVLLLLAIGCWRAPRIDHLNEVLRVQN